MPRLVNNFTNTIANTVQVAYTSPQTGSGTRIDAFTATNNSNVTGSYRAYIDDGDSGLFPIIPERIVVWGESDIGIGIVNQVIPPNGILKIESNAANAIYFTIAGVNLT